jgi:hypothetical protein
MIRRTTIDTGPTRGEVRLLHDLLALERMLEPESTPARTRLERELGAGFADAVRSSLLEPTVRAA